MISNFSASALIELDALLTINTNKGEFHPKPILDTLRKRGFFKCFYFDAAEDQVHGDYLLILSSFLADDLHEDILGRSIALKTSAIGIQDNRNQIVAINSGNDNFPEESLRLATEVGIAKLHRVHIPLHSNENLVGAITCAWDGEFTIMDDSFKSGLELFAILIEKHIHLATERYVQQKVGEIRAVFEASKKFDELDKFLDTGVNLVRSAVDGAAASIFDFNWYSGYLTKTHESIGIATDKRLPERYPVGKFLTGKAWNDSSVRYIIDFESFKASHNQEVCRESEKYHKEVIGGVRTVLYEKFGTDDRQFLIRIFNRLQNHKLPFYISQKLLLKQIAREFEFLLNDIVLERKLSDIQAVSRVALENITQSHLAFQISVKKLYNECVQNALFLAFDKKARIVTHCHSTIKGLEECVSSVIGDKSHTLLNAVVDSKTDQMIRLSDYSSDPWRTELVKKEISYIYTMPASSAYKNGAFAICVPTDSVGSAEQIYRRIPENHKNSVRSYAAIVGVCVEAEESLLTSQSAKRLIGSIGHEVQGPVSLVVGAANSALQETMEILDDLKINNSGAYAEGNFDKVYRKLLESERVLENQSERVNVIMRVAKELAQETKGGGSLQMHFSPYNLFEVLKEAEFEVLKTVQHIDAFGRNQRFVFQFNDSCKKFPSMIGDKTLLTKVFVNLFFNAVKYSLPPGKGQPIAVTVIGIPQSGQSIVQVKNFGMAIPHEDRETIFLPFERGFTKDRMKARRGMGLGLYLARKIALGHKGTVFLKKSEPTFDDSTRRDAEGWETTFEVRLPHGLPEGTYDYES